MALRQSGDWQPRRRSGTLYRGGIFHGDKGTDEGFVIDLLLVMLMEYVRRNIYEVVVKNTNNGETLAQISSKHERRKKH